MLGRVRLLGLLAAVALLPVLPAARADAAVYWGSGSSIGAANVDGSMLIDSFPTGAANLPPDGSVVGVAVSGAYLYWGDNSSGSIGAMALPGAPDGRVLPGEAGAWMNEALVPNVERPWGLAADSSHLYWASVAGAIGRANLDGSAADRAFIAGLAAPCGVAVDGGHVYWADIEKGHVGRAKLDGTAVEPEFIADVGAACGVAVNASHIYWATEGAIGRARIDGGDPDPAFISPAGHPCGLAVDAAHLYWANFVEPGVFVSRANLDGSQPARFIGAPHYAAMCGVALDSRVFQPRPPPASLPIRFGEVKRRKKGRLLVLPVYVPERGELTLASPPKLGWRLDKGTPPPPWRGGGFTWKLKLWPGEGRVGKRIRRQLRNHRRAPVNLIFNWEQQGRTPVAASKRLAFVPRPSSQHPK